MSSRRSGIRAAETEGPSMPHGIIRRGCPIPDPSSPQELSEGHPPGRSHRTAGPCGTGPDPGTGPARHRRPSPRLRPARRQARQEHRADHGRASRPRHGPWYHHHPLLCALGTDDTDGVPTPSKPEKETSSSPATSRPCRGSTVAARIPGRTRTTRCSRGGSCARPPRRNRTPRHGTILGPQAPPLRLHRGRPTGEVSGGLLHVRHSVRRYSPLRSVPRVQVGRELVDVLRGLGADQLARSFRCSSCGVPGSAV